MTSETESVSAVEAAAMRDLQAAADLDALEVWRLAYLGRKGRLSLLLRTVSQLSIEERKTVGREGNELKNRLEAAHEARQAELEQAHLTHVIESEGLDVTLPGPPHPHGRLHPITQTMRDMLAAFGSMGFQVAEGPEIEWDHYNFEKLRIPQDHPARDMWDTLWIDYEKDGKRPMLLRTHTSPNQIRVMEQREPPIRIVVPGKCYRFEATDATHEWMLTQIEGLAVDEGISLTDLKGTLAEFARRMFGQERKVQFLCSYFPFVEP
ncbi:MAG: phenylalanine--tRNA ligase subunit alpha, partial [Chloroflexota bacterium]